MTDPREILRQFGAPKPLATVMQTEIRSDGGLKLQLLAPPQWSTGTGTAVILEWACELDLDALSKVSVLLREPNRDTGLQAEDAINRTLLKAGLGSFMGTFIDDGRPPYRVYVLIALRPDRPLTEEQLNQELSTVFNVPPPPPPAPATIESQAAEVLRALRSYWWSGQSRSESRSMLLSLCNIDTLMNRSLSYAPKP